VNKAIRTTRRDHEPPRAGDLHKREMGLKRLAGGLFSDRKGGKRLKLLFSFLKTMDLYIIWVF